MSIHSKDIRKVSKTWRIDSNIPLFYFNLFEENNFRGENDDFRELVVAGGGSIGRSLRSTKSTITIFPSGPTA